MTRQMLIVCGLAFGLSVPLSAQAQQPGPALETAPPTLDPKACADRDRLTLGDTHELQSKGTTGESTSDKLARTDGVICPPPDLDPAIRAPAPDTGRTPVIPPPGSPGGDPSLRPK
ncbi:MAG: hypothetical protein HXY30_05415 [Pseudorhodoplanes sp.]|nr:hypothetical protein [Pseudorhodoplanes sp.]